MTDADFDTVTTIAAERSDIGIMIFIMSSTSIGKNLGVYSYLYKDAKTYLNRKYKKVKSFLLKHNCPAT